jgi:hypothetical protein
VIGSIGRVDNGEGPFELLPGSLVVAKVSELPADQVLLVAQIRVIGTQRLLGNGQRPFGQRFCLP